jgi:MFS family permease
MDSFTKKDFFNFCLIFLLSVFGYELIFFIMTLYVFNLTQNAVNVSFFAVLTFIPKLLSPLYGALADRFRKQRVLLAASLATAGLMAALSMVKSMEWIYTLWFVTAILLALITNIRGSLFAEIVPKQNYSTGNSTMLILSNGSRIVAPLIGGAAALLFDARLMFFAISAIYILAAGLSSLIKSSHESRENRENKPAFDLAAGYRYIRQNPLVNYVFTLSFFWRLFLGLQVSILVIYVKTTLAGNDSQYGYFMTIISLGSVLGSLLGTWLAKYFSRNILMTAGLGLHYASFSALGLVNQFLPACVLGFFSFIAFYAALVSIHTMRDAGTQPSVRGRVYGTVTAIITLPAILSMLAGGYLAQRVGVNVILISAGMLALVSLLVINRIFSPARLQNLVEPSPATPVI